MGNIHIVRFVYLLLGLLAQCVLSSSVFAAEYTWKLYSHPNTGTFSSASAACASYSPSGSAFTGTLRKNGGFLAGTAYDCLYGPPTNNWGETAIRTGDTCPAGTTFNADKGACLYPADKMGQVCSDQKGLGGVPYVISSDGACVSLNDVDKRALCKYMADGGVSYKKIKVIFDSDGTHPAPDVDYGSAIGCEVDVQVSSTCLLPPAVCEKSSQGSVCLPKNSARCVASISFTGNVLPGSGPLQIASPDGSDSGLCVDSENCKLPDMPKVDENKQCNYVLDGDGRKVCDSRQFTGEPGSVNCGEINGGAYGCTPKVPKSNGIDISTGVDTKSNSDGSTTSTKTDVATKYDCSGNYSDCKVTTTTTTTTTTKNAAGEVTGSSSETTCKGDSCSGSSSGGGGGNNGKGDDTTNCDPATDPKACEGTSTDGGGKKCDAPIQCDGDAVMCAILQQQHKDTCELMADPTDEEKSKFEQDKSAEIAKVDDLQEDLDQKASGLFADFKVKASGGQYAGQCLADKEVDIMGTSFTFPFSKACPYLYLLRYAIIAMAYLAAARIVSRGI